MVPLGAAATTAARAAAGRREENRMNIFRGRAGELSCEGDGMVFADGELFCSLSFYTARRTSTPFDCTPLHTAHSPVMYPSVQGAGNHFDVTKSQGWRLYHGI